MKSIKPIPIILLHYNEFEFLSECIESIYLNTKHPFKLYVVDNQSKNNEKFWELLSKKYKNVDIIFNPKNNWVYGFNLAISKNKSNYYLLSDADIVFPKPYKGVCWLTHLVKQIQQNKPIGKIGLSLNLDLIKNDPKLIKLYQRELGYKYGETIGSNIIAPVDTTAALYRADLFMNLHSKFFMRIGHFSNIKPYYYSVRTSSDYECIHLGWKKYKLYNTEEYKLDLIDKINFFAYHGIKVEDELLLMVSFFRRIKYKLTLKIMRGYYAFIILINYFVFCLLFKSRKFFRKLYDGE